AVAIAAVAVILAAAIAVNKAAVGVAVVAVVAAAVAGVTVVLAAVVAVAEGTDMVDLARNVINFFRNESCGKCVPCRTGTEDLVHMLDQVLDGQAHSKTLGPVPDVSEAMALTSICGLGQAAPVPVTSMLKYFPDEIEKYL
ncbi:MAG: NADH-ubiquinone oxidoreductase-F iron-sulfur binding region domain-containing protein, partial [Candidatus Latescibacteria bacterium]|nr:NADH-ubiquinone oxidoreductase-F iron-sulfur binding region domain-containing protein [Candidatus Latescibacterota bacterium]